MRQFVPLDLRNINDQYVRSQLRRLNDFIQDLANSLSSDLLVPGAPDNITNITNIINNLGDVNAEQAIRQATFDDCLRNVAATINIEPHLNEIDWSTFRSTPGPSTVDQDVATFDPLVNPGVWKFSTGGNIGESTYITTNFGLISTSHMYRVRPRTPWSMHIGAAISSATQRIMFRAGLLRATAGAFFPTTFIGFVWWFTDEDYAPGGSYSTLTIGNDPGAGNRTNMFMTEVVSNGEAVAQVIDNASNHTTIEDYEIRIVGAAAEFYVNGRKVATMSCPPATEEQGDPFVGLRSSGTNNPGGTRLAYLDYVSIDA